MALEGQSIKKIASALSISLYDITEILNNCPKFSKSFNNCRFNGIESLADDLLDIADQYDDVQRARLKSENLRWIISKRKPATYGERIQVDTQVIDITGALAEARNRVKPVSDLREDEKEDNLVIPTTYTRKETDSESDIDAKSQDDEAQLDDLLS